MALEIGPYGAKRVHASRHMALIYANMLAAGVCVAPDTSQMIENEIDLLDSLVRGDPSRTGEIRPLIAEWRLIGATLRARYH